MTGRCLLFVHAHPDDESLTTGVAIAHHALAGDDVHVLTCTLGEEGEVIPPALAHLEGAEGDPLATHRLGELRAAVAALGATSHVLGLEVDDDGARAAYRDSGMAGSASATHPRALVAAPLARVAEDVAGVVATVRPHVVVTYDASGGYGHPDHVRVHDATCAALAALASPPSLYAVLTPRSWAREDRAWLLAHPEATGEWHVPGPTEPFVPSVVDDDAVTHAVVDPAALVRQVEALRGHTTQVTVGDGCYALSNRVAARLSGREGYALLDPATGAVVGAVDGAGPSGRPGLLGEVPP